MDFFTSLMLPLVLEEQEHIQSNPYFIRINLRKGKATLLAASRSQSTLKPLLSQNMVHFTAITKSGSTI